MRRYEALNPNQSHCTQLKSKIFSLRGVPPQISGFVCAFHTAAPVRVPCTPTTLFSIYKVQIVNLSLELECEKNKNKQKEAVIGPFKKILPTVKFSMNVLLPRLYHKKLFPILVSMRDSRKIAEKSFTALTERTETEMHKFQRQQ